MKLRYIFLMFVMVLWGGTLMAQVDRHQLDATTHGTLINVQAGLNFALVDDGGDDKYTAGKDYYVSIKGPCEEPLYLSLYFDNFDIAYTDTVYVYDGPSINDPLIIKGNNNYHPMNQKYFYPSPSNTTKTLTVRLKTAANSPRGDGFLVSAECKSVCENINPVIEMEYYRTRNGQVYDTSITKMVYTTKLDTSFDADGNFTPDSIHLDTINSFRGVNLCIGEGVRLKGKLLWDPVYGTGHYTPSNDNTTFIWDFGNQTLDDDGKREGIGLSEVDIPAELYGTVGCFNILLSLKDSNGCVSLTTEKVVVRTSPNPIKTIFDLATICTGDTLVTTLGYDGDNATITLNKIEFSKTASKVNDVRTFIPDGPHCAVNCYSAPVKFNEFPAGKKITEKSEICSLCINYEHTFMGDYRLSLVCPNGSKAVLKFASAWHDPQFNGGSPDPNTYPRGSYDGSGMRTGIAFRSAPYDGSDVCDSLSNTFGKGWNYCFSRNEDYTLIDGLPANTTTVGAHYMASSNEVSASEVVDPSPSYFTNPYPGGTVNQNTQDSSDYFNKTGYYMPWSDFSELVGCPMNGQWEVEICDYWGIDNGWVFNWTLDLCGVTGDNDCQYQVGIDSVLWTPDTIGGLHYDMETGRYRGLEIFPIDSVSSGIVSADTAGVFPIDITLFDEFGCEWNDSVQITTTWTPRPELGEGGAVCGDDYIVLDAKDHYANRGNYTYIWDPYGQNTDTVHTGGSYGDEINYVVEVYNTQNGVRCIGRDTVKVNVSVQPIPNFDVDQYPLEGCEPYTINIKNTSLDASSYRWEFGDGTVSTEKDPRHTYSTGTYDFKLYVFSEAGCKDSLVYNQLVTVFPSPDARFSWNPVYPTMTDPTVHLESHTIPDDPAIDHFWEIQYDKDYPYSYHTLQAKDTSFTWETNGEDISGDYVVRLIARSKNMGPSGYPVYCPDTIENTVLILNDFIQFPNLVTPNGDGVNDKFVIINLISGQAYPTNCLDIYNKWGARVFHKENIANEEDFWDPAADNTPSGTYFYHFTGRGYNGSVERNGSVEVLR